MNFDIISVFISVLVLTILIVVHEFGHFLAAKHYGFQTPVFGVGLPFGPHIELFEKWGTKFRFYWFLIGGFVSIPELGDETNPEMLKQMDIKGPLKSFPVHQRAVVASGGIVFNILFALLLAIIMAATIGLPKADSNNKISTYVSSNSIAKASGILEGDRIVQVAETLVTNGDELKEAFQGFKAQEVSIIVEREIAVSDEIKKLDNYSPEFEKVKLNITPSENGTIGVILDASHGYQKFDFNPITWVWESTKFIANTLIGMTVTIIAMLGTLVVKAFGVFFPQPVDTGVELGQVKGIVGIIQLISEDIQSNWIMVFEFAILLSLNLAVINLLPIPALDGGHLLFMAYEGLAGKKLSEKVQEGAIQFGFLFLLTVIALTTVNDIKNWFFG